MIFTAIIYTNQSTKRKGAVKCVSDNFEDARKKLLLMYGDNLVSIIYELSVNAEDN